MADACRICRKPLDQHSTYRAQACAVARDAKTARRLVKARAKRHRPVRLALPVPRDAFVQLAEVPHEGDSPSGPWSPVPVGALPSKPYLRLVLKVKV